ncbi:MAG TPA: DUF1223 domain-containing protein [Terriglobales bacterium]|nr:DUF1223 domain-containing protein [Terriglobales bacterium]
MAHRFYWKRHLQCLPLACVTLVLTFSSRAFAENSKPILIELFTSEGCSSCPPADALLRALDSAQPIVGAQLIVLEEHVDYWDDQGWRDPFSSHSFTVRQTDYVEHLHLKDGPYTPQMVVDGTEAFVGSDRTLLARALQKVVVAPKISIDISSPHIESGKLIAHLSTGEVPTKAEVFIALALDHAQSQVLRGENGGKHLEHVAVVKRLSNVGKVKKGESFSKDVSLGLDSSEQPYRMVAFIQEGSDGPVLGATVLRVPQLTP